MDDDEIDKRLDQLRKGDVVEVETLAELAEPQGTLRRLRSRLDRVHERGAYVLERSTGRRSNTKAVVAMIFDAATVLRKGLTPKQAHANGSKGGRPLKPRETSKEVAEKHWFDMRWKTDAEAMKHAPGWYPNLAWRHFGPSGRPRKGSRKRSARNSKRS